MDAGILRSAPRHRLPRDAVQSLVAHSDARFFDKQREDGPKLDTSDKPEPPADKASRGREMGKGLWNVNLNQGSSMNELMLFQKEEFGQVRVVEHNGEPWFVAKDVCECLELTNASQTLSYLDDDERDIISNDTPGGKQNMLIVSEPGLYSLVLRSRKPEAKAFKRWIVHEVLPAIRKHGIYATENVVNQILDNPEFGIQLLTALKEEREARVNAEKRVAILSHVRKTYTTTEIAKELGFRSAVAFNRVLCEQHIQYKQNGTYVLYAEYAELGYVHIKQEVLENDKVVYHRRWTQLGREWLIGRFGIKAA